MHKQYTNIHIYIYIYMHTLLLLRYIYISLLVIFKTSTFIKKQSPPSATLTNIITNTLATSSFLIFLSTN